MPANALPYVISSRVNAKGLAQSEVKLQTPSGTFTLTLSIAEQHESPLDAEIDSVERAIEHLTKTTESLNRELAARKARRGT